MDWIHLAEDSIQWWALLNMIMNLQVPWKAEDFLIGWVLISHKGPCSMQLVISYVEMTF